MTDRQIGACSLTAAMALHALLLLIALFQYNQVMTHPERANVAVRRLQDEKPESFRFIYVEGDEASDEPPEDSARLSDIQRRGASPDGERGDSPDPRSEGTDFSRRLGGPRVPPRAGMGNRGSPASPAVPPRPGRTGSPGRGAAAAEVGAVAEPTGGILAQDAPGTRRGSPALRVPPGGAPAVPASPGAAPTPGASPSPGGMNEWLQQIHVEAIQGGFDNPIASRLKRGEVSFDTAAWDLGPYAKKVQQIVEGNWHLPYVLENLGQRGWVSILFAVRKDGTIEIREVEKPSEIPSLNQSALNALRTSSPLPPLPPQVTVPEITGKYRFFLNMSPGDVKRE